MSRLQGLVLTALIAVGVLASSVTANAAPGDPFQYKFTFGEEIGVSWGQIAVNHETGNVLVVGRDNKVHQFDAEGNPVAFPAVGSPELPGDPEIRIDNSGGPSQGNFYTWGGTYLRAYHADGSPIGESTYVGESMGPGVYQPGVEEVFFNFLANAGGIFVEADGTLWVTTSVVFGECGCITELVAYSPEMVPTGERYDIDATITAGFPFATGPVIDGLGNVYAGVSSYTYHRLDRTNEFTDLGETGLTMRGDRIYPNQLAIDPATNDVYLAYDASLNTDSQGFKGTVTASPTNSTPASPSVDVLTPDKGVRAAGGIALDGTGQTLYLAEEGKLNVFHREPPSAPRDLAAPRAKQVRSYGAVLEAGLIDGGAPTTFRYEYGTTTSYGASSESFVAPRGYYQRGASAAVPNLEPDTRYHVRMVATNSAGTTYGPDGTFRTYPESAGGADDPCPNALARKQTVAQRLPECRAYELASAADTGGYDVASYLAPGQDWFPGFPLATDKLLYAIHSGAVPGPWNATNKGPDPYVATRTPDGWVTEYKGLPSDLNTEAGSFSSVLGEADSSLSTLAFAGQNLCDPCFTDDGLRTGLPVRLPSGQLVQGMVGSQGGSVPETARPEGKVAQYFSQGGQHLVFASKYAFEPGANTDGDLTVYDHNLASGTTQIVSTDGNGDPLTGTVSELRISSDGARIVTASKLGDDGAGNEYVHPWMHIGSSANGIDLALGTTTGVLFAGMTADGSKAFYTTRDKLVSEDTDTSADLYEAAVDGSGILDLSVITQTDVDACNPVSNSSGAHWNTTGASANCDAVAISGGGGIATQSGAVYFLSPEAFGGGTLDQPNLYLAQPGGSPEFVTTLEPDNPLVLDSVKANAVRKTGDFQVTPSGAYAAFTSDSDLSGISTHGFRSVFRYAAGSEQLDCVSCDRTETVETKVFGAAELPPNGLALLEDGRLFFTTAAQLLLNDANFKQDVYEWNGGNPQLISAGTGPFDSGLLSASADGTDVFFFTHDNLAREEDRNGALMRVYDAREGGGFFKLPPPVPCQASDECHGPGTPAPAPSDIKSSGETTRGNVIACPEHRVKKRGKCVKKTAHKKKKRKKKKGHTKERAAAINGRGAGS